MTTVQQYDESSYFQDTLRAAGFKKPPLLRRFGTGTVVLLVALIFTMRIGSEILSGELRWPDILTVLAGFVIFSVGYLQWRAVRQEITFDKFYDKLDVANKRFDAWRIERLKSDHEKLEDHLHTMFFFAELDNLEYVIEKYQLGYVKRELAERAMRTFESRCVEERFRSCALYFLGAEEGEQVARGFQRTTRMVVRHMCHRCRAQSEEVPHNSTLNRTDTAPSRGLAG